MYVLQIYAIHKIRIPYQVKKTAQPQPYTQLPIATANERSQKNTGSPQHPSAATNSTRVLVSKQWEKRLCSSTIWRTGCRFRTGPIKHNMKNLASSLVNSYVLITSSNLRSTQSKRPMQILQIKTMLLNQQIVESSWLHLKTRERSAKTHAHGGHVSKTNEGRWIWRSTVLLFLPYRIYTGFNPSSLSRSSLSILSLRGGGGS
jgi:hypothetical protein